MCVINASTVPSSPPQNVIVSSVNPASLNVSWQPPLEIDLNGPITGYVIQYTRVGSSDMMSVNVTSGTTQTISGLAAYVNYSVTVAAMTLNGTGPFSNPVVERSGEFGELNWINIYSIVLIINLKNYEFKKGSKIDPAIKSKETRCRLCTRQYCIIYVANHYLPS